MAVGPHEQVNLLSCQKGLLPVFLKMKLLIKKKYFDNIKSGKKTFELSDAHITLVCISSGEELRKEVNDVSIDFSANFPQFKDVLEDERVIVFDLK